MITITIDTNNAAFDNRTQEEICDILDRIKKNINEHIAGEYTSIKDSNGNTIGQFTIEEV